MFVGPGRGWGGWGTGFGEGGFSEVDEGYGIGKSEGIGRVRGLTRGLWDVGA